LVQNPTIKHGDIRILFTPDEEIGRGVDKVDLKKLNADFAYTVDGETLGSIEDETFSADGVKLIINGVSAHPGFAKGKMESAIKILAEILSALPKNELAPESTSNKEGFVHPVSFSGQVEQAEAHFIIRDFDDELLKVHESRLEEIVKDVLKAYKGASYQFIVTEQYRNMKKVLDKYPQIIEYGIEAIERAGLKPIKRSIRGGTDGSRLSYMGLPCPNILQGSMLSTVNKNGFRFRIWKKQCKPS
jgi:tripeptide aminopeptidase